MKILFACLAAFLLLMGRGEAASAVPLSGVIEGFYGTPWTEAERLDMIAFCGDHGLTAYVYAPKDDPYHREKWREPYPAAELSDLARLVAAADAHHVRFVFAVSPGLDLHLGNGEAADRAAMLAKFEALYALGVRDFAVFFDDIQNRDGAGQAAFLRAVDGELRARHPDVHPLLTVPTEYGYDVMQDGTGAPTDYTRAFAAGLRGSGIIVLYTGDGVARRGLTAERLAAAARLYDGSPLGLWWNYPVNDYEEPKLALGPMEPLPLTGVPAMFFNPMKYERLSKIALATGADLVRDPAHYDAETAWQRAIQNQYGTADRPIARASKAPARPSSDVAAPSDLAAAMQTFADHSTHLENHWADIGRDDAPELRHAIGNLFAAMDQGAPSSVTASRIHDLDARCAAIVAATQTLAQRLDAATLEECRPQLHRLETLATASRSGLALLAAQQRGTDAPAARAHFRALRTELAEDPSAKISDDALCVLVEGMAERMGE